VRSGHDSFGLALGLFDLELIKSTSLYPSLTISSSDDLLGFLAGSLYSGFGLPMGFLNPTPQFEFFLVDGLQGGGRFFHSAVLVRTQGISYLRTTFLALCLL